MTASRHASAIPYGQYRRALAYVAPYWRGLLAVMLLGLFSTAVGLAQPYISRLLIDDALLRRNLHALTYIAVAMVAVTIGIPPVPQRDSDLTKGVHEQPGLFRSINSPSVLDGSLRLRWKEAYSPRRDSGPSCNLSSTSPGKSGAVSTRLGRTHMVEARISPHLEFVLELRVNIGTVLELGWGSFGLRRMLPITGGIFRGPGISGRVLPGGADWQFVDRDGLTLVDAHYILETTDATRIEVSNPGIRHGAQDVLDRIAAGEPVAPSQYYFRTTPRFYPPDGKYDWLKRSIFVGNAERYAELVVVKVWRVA